MLHNSNYSDLLIERRAALELRRERLHWIAATLLVAGTSLLGFFAGQVLFYLTHL